MSRSDFRKLWHIDWVVGRYVQQKWVNTTRREADMVTIKGTLILYNKKRYFAVGATCYTVSELILKDQCTRSNEQKFFQDNIDLRVIYKKTQELNKKQKKTFIFGCWFFNMEHYFICYTQLAKLDCSSSLVLFTITFLILYLDSGKSHLVWNVDTLFGAAKWHCCWYHYSVLKPSHSLGLVWWKRPHISHILCCK